MILVVLRSRARGLLGRSPVGLRVQGAVSGNQYALPVMYATDPAGLVVVPGRPAAKRWWRNLRRSAPVSVLRDGTWRPAIGEVLDPGDEGYDAALATYRRRWPRARAGAGPVVRIGPVRPGPGR